MFSPSAVRMVKVNLPGPRGGGKPDSSQIATGFLPGRRATKYSTDLGKLRLIKFHPAGEEPAGVRFIYRYRISPLQREQLP